MNYLFDAAFKPDLAKVKAVGGIAMSVYLTGTYSTTCAQPAELHAIGLGALANWERAPDALLTAGHDGGVSIGREAATAAIAKGFPAGKGVEFSVDVNAAPVDFPAIGAAFDGINVGLGLDGRFLSVVYGEGALIDYLVRTGRVVQGGNWLSGSESFPGWDASDVNVALVQRVSSPVPGTDLDDITNLGAIAPLIWWPPNSPYEGADMTPEQAKQLQDLHDRLAKFDTLSYASGLMLPAVADIRAKVAVLAGQQGQTVDVPTLASDLATALGPDLGKQLVTALGTALAAK